MTGLSWTRAEPGLRLGWIGGLGWALPVHELTLPIPLSLPPFIHLSLPPRTPPVTHPSPPIHVNHLMKYMYVASVAAAQTTSSYCVNHAATTEAPPPRRVRSQSTRDSAGSRVSVTRRA